LNGSLNVPEFKTLLTNNPVPVAAAIAAPVPTAAATLLFLRAIAPKRAISENAINIPSDGSDLFIPNT
jgi:hypothetical protein